MSRIPALTPKKIIAVLLQNGFVLKHTTGSHYIYYHPIRGNITLVSYHNKDIPRGTLKEIIKQSGLSRSAFL